MPKQIKGDGRKIVLSVRRFCEMEKAYEAPLIPFERVRKRVAALTGISEKTVTNITKESKVSTSTSKKISTPQRKRNLHNMKIQIDAIDVCAIRNKIYFMYTVRKEVPTLRNLLDELKSDINFSGGRTTLWKTIRNIGFQFKNCGSKRKLLMERFDIVAWRHKYLEILRQNRTKGRPVVFLGETCLQPSCFVKKCEHEDKEDVLDATGVRWIIIHAGGEMGFIQDAKLMIKSLSKSSDFHDVISKTIFMKWLEEKLIPNLPPNSLIVMDNAPYHTVTVNKAPSASSSKADMQNWIINKRLSYRPTMVKAELYEIIKKHKEAPIYEVDELLEAHGHKVARLPPHHSNLNAIEFIWSILKMRIASNNIEQKAGSIVELTEKAFQSITAEDWQRHCELVRHIEDNLREMDRAMDAEIDKFVTARNDNESDETESESDNSFEEDSSLSDNDF